MLRRLAQDAAKQKRSEKRVVAHVVVGVQVGSATRKTREPCGVLMLEVCA
jgi:hypothetical protein